jgi:5-methylcytosine-specific restriction endonuclease McrA
VNLEERQAEMKNRKTFRASHMSPATLKYRERRMLDAAKAAKKRRDSESFDPSSYDDVGDDVRLKVLEDWANVLLEPLTYDELQTRRRAFDSVKTRKFPLYVLDKTILTKMRQVPYPCWVCRSRDAVHRHHVVLLKNGGTVAAKSNVVLLCELCHSKIHPWMELNLVKPVTYAEFELVRCQREASVLLDKAARGRFATPEQADAQFSDLLRSVFNALAKK